MSVEDDDFTGLLTIHLEISPPFRSGWSCEISMGEGGYIACVRSGDGEEPDTYILPEEAFQDLTERARNLSAGLFPPYSCRRGAVGGCHLHLKNGLNEIRFQWQGEAPAAWSEVDRLVRAVLRVVRFHCLGEPGPWGNW
jgi:hypothetical protein